MSAAAARATDNFWFCLFHEIAHLRLHLGDSPRNWHVDDLDVTDTSKHEKEADKWAQDRLIPPNVWTHVQNRVTAEDVELAAQELQISPSIIAGRIRYDRKNHKLFSKLGWVKASYTIYFPWNERLFTLFQPLALDAFGRGVILEGTWPGVPGATERPWRARMETGCRP
jgi:hypothetical protein